VRTPEQGGTTCAGVRGITGDGLPSKVIELHGTYKEEAYNCYVCICENAFVIFPDKRSSDDEGDA